MGIFMVMPAQAQGEERNRLENWYTNWGLGYARVSYPSPLDDVVQELRDAASVGNASLYLDVLGFYWPLSEQAILGFNVNIWGDAYSAGGEDLTFVGATYGASFMYFLQNRIGDGPFLRVDAGPSRISLSSDSFDAEFDSDLGFGFLVGGGYGFPVSRETRILLHVFYGSRQVEGDSWGNLGIGVSGLF